MLADAERKCDIPCAMIELRSPFINGLVEVLVLDEPIEDILIGNKTRRYAETEMEQIPVYPIVKSVQ
jgi:hypothetical protein